MPPSFLRDAFVLDRSPRGLLELHGSDRVLFLQGMVSNTVVGLQPGERRHAALLDSTGHILADLHLHARAESLVIETDPACLSVLHRTLDKLLIMEDVQIVDISRLWSVVSVYNISASHLLSRKPPLPDEITSTAFPIVPGTDLWTLNADKAALWSSLLNAGVSPISAEEAEALRIDAGIPKWGAELTSSILLPEAEMPDAVSYTKGCYVGQEIVARLQARGHTNKALRQIALAEDAPVPPVGATVHVPEDGPEPGREIGRVTSAAASARQGGRSVALAYIRKEYFDSGTPVSVQIAQPNGLMFAYAGIVQLTPASVTDAVELPEE